MALLINRSACKKALLEIAATRARKFTRVGSDVFEHLDFMLRREMAKIIATHPSLGVTISMGTKKTVEVPE
jgi:hypothetical protein